MPRGVYPRKKKTVAEKPVTAPRSAKTAKAYFERIPAPKILKLDELSLLKLSKLDAEVRALSSDIIIQKGTYEGLIAKVDPKGVLQGLLNKVQLLTASLHEKRQEYAKVRELIGEEYGIDMKNYAYDDVTGVLHDLAQAPQEPLPTEKSETLQ